MNYKIYTTNGERLTIEADRFDQDGSGTRLYKEDAVVAAFYSGEVARIFPEGAIEEAEVTPKPKPTKK